MLRPDGFLAIVDKNIAVAFGPAAVDAQRRRSSGSTSTGARWMYPAGGPVRERWFWPGALRRRAAAPVRGRPGGPPPLPGRAGVVGLPARSLGEADDTLGGKGRGRSPCLSCIARCWPTAPPAAETPPGSGADPGAGGNRLRSGRDPYPFGFRRGRFVLYDGRQFKATGLRRLLTHEHVAIDVDTLRSGRAGRSLRGPRRPPRCEGGLEAPAVEPPRAGVTPAEGVDPPPADRGPARTRPGGGRALDAALPVPASVSLGVQLPGRPG